MLSSMHAYLASYLNVLPLPTFKFCFLLAHYFFPDPYLVSYGWDPLLYFFRFGDCSSSGWLSSFIGMGISSSSRHLSYFLGVGGSSCASPILYFLSHYPFLLFPFLGRFSVHPLWWPLQMISSQVMVPPLLIRLFLMTLGLSGHRPLTTLLLPLWPIMWLSILVIGFVVSCC